MDTGALDELHYAGDKHLSAVADGVYLDLFAHDVFVNKHGLILIDINGVSEILSEHLLVRHYLHSPAAEHEARAHENGVADTGGNSRTCFDIRDRLALRVRNAEGFYNRVKRVSVLRALYSVAVRADYLHSALCKRSGKVDGGLTAREWL